MEILGGIAVIALLLGIGSRQWRYAVREKLAERREDRRLRRKYDL